MFPKLIESFEELWSQGKYLCVGLDAVAEKFPLHLRGAENTLAFCTGIVEATRDHVAAYKPNVAFFERLGADGFEILRSVVKEIRRAAPQALIILDAKRGDISSTNEGYVENAFNYFGCDAITLHPYLGHDSLLPFMKMSGKALFVLCRTSNPGAGEFQDLECAGKPVYLHVADRVANHWTAEATLGLVVGATYPEDLAKVRRIADSTPILIPGIGAQGGDLKKTLRANVSRDGKHRMLINASRSVIYASEGRDFAERAAEEAEQLHVSIRTSVEAMRV